MQEPLSDVREIYDPNGDLKSRVTVKDSVLNGPAESYYEGGKVLKAKFQYRNGKKHGLEKRYYKSGELYRERDYRNGRLQGTERRYFRTGKLRTEVEYKDSNPSTGLIEFKTNGEKIVNWPELTMKQGRTADGLIRLTFFFSDRSKVVRYYEGELLEGRYFDRSQTPLTEIAGVGEKLIYENELSRITISARRTTKSNAPHIVSKTFEIR